MKYCLTWLYHLLLKLNKKLKQLDYEVQCQVWLTGNKQVLQNKASNQNLSSLILPMTQTYQALYHQRPKPIMSYITSGQNLSSLISKGWMMYDYIVGVF